MRKGVKTTQRHGIIINLSHIESNNELENVFRNRKIDGKIYKGYELCFILEDCDATKLSSIKDRDDSKNNLNLNNLNNSNNSNNKELPMDLISIINNKKEFDLSCFLNILDGIIELYGVMIIVTTNYPEK